MAPLQWLAFYTGLRTITAFLGQVLSAVRETSFIMKVQIATLVICLVHFTSAATGALQALPPHGPLRIRPRPFPSIRASSG